MAHSEIIVHAGHPDGVVFEYTHLESEQAITDGYARFKDIISERADWLLHASVKRDFEDNMLVDITLRIGPKPFWTEEYLKEHGLGKFALPGVA